MRDLEPQLLAASFQPYIQCRNIRELRHGLPKPVAGILNILLDLAFLPPCGRVAKLGLEHVVAGHRKEPGVDLPFLAPANTINCCAHVVVDASRGHATKDPETMHMRIKKHLVGLQGISPQQKRPAVRQLDMRHLQLGALAAQNRKILAPVKLKRLARLKHQRHKGSAPRRLQLLLSICPPHPGKGGNPAVGPGISQPHQIIMQLL